MYAYVFANRTTRRRNFLYSFLTDKCLIAVLEILSFVVNRSNLAASLILSSCLLKNDARKGRPRYENCRGHFAGSCSSQRFYMYGTRHCTHTRTDKCTFSILVKVTRLSNERSSRSTIIVKNRIAKVNAT